MYYYVCILRKTRPRVCIIFICHSMQLCVRYVCCLVTVTGGIRALNRIKDSSVTLIAERDSVHPMANVSHVSVPKVLNDSRDLTYAAQPRQMS